MNAPVLVVALWSRIARFSSWFETSCGIRPTPGTEASRSRMLIPRMAIGVALVVARRGDPRRCGHAPNTAVRESIVPCKCTESPRLLGRVPALIRAERPASEGCTRLQATDEERDFRPTEPSRRRDSNPRHPLYEGDLGPGTEGPCGRWRAR